jgi:hypothetical protein
MYYFPPKWLCQQNLGYLYLDFLHHCQETLLFSIAATVALLVGGGFLLSVGGTVGADVLLGGETDDTVVLVVGGRFLLSDVVLMELMFC